MVHIWRKVFLWAWIESVRWSWVLWDIDCWFEKENSDFQDRFTLNEDVSASGSIMWAVDVFKTEEYSDWKIEWVVKMNSITPFLINVFWTHIKTDLWGWAFQHGFTLQESNTHPSLIIAKKDPIEWKIYNLAMVKTLEITAEIGEALKVVIELESKKWVINNSITTSFPVDVAFLSRFWILKFATAFWWLDAAIAMKLRSFKIKFNQNTEKRWSLWDIWPAEIVNKTYDVTWTVEFDYEDTIVKTMAQNAETKAMMFSIIDTEKTIWTDDNPILDFRFYKVWFTWFEVMEWNDDVVTQSLNFKWLYDQSTWNTLTCILQNTLNI